MPNYLLKITLKDTQHLIWRRFVVPSDIRLDQLHDVIQIVMGWHNSHFHSFLVGKQQYMPRSALMDGITDDLPEEEYTLNKIAARKGAKFKYWYDFGDDWIHEIVVESTDYANPDWPYPICCIEGVRACPPDDCGGVYGFADFCEAMADPKHPRHRELKSWFGGKFDPDRFDLDAVNKNLGVGRSSAQKKTTKKAVKKTVKKTAKKKAKKKPRAGWVFIDKSDEKKTT